MPSQSSFELASLSVVKPGIQDALSVVGARLVQYLDAPALNAPALEEARSELHRIQGVLRMIRLDGVAVYCAEIEQVLTELAANANLASLLYRSVLQRALTGLTDYLDALMQGADNASLSLFPKYEAMQHLRGLEMSFEQDLFFPNLAVKLPDTVLNIAQADSPDDLIKAAHSQYQRGLMSWLKNSDEGLGLMQDALDTVLTCLPQNNTRDFWWIASGLLDCVEQDSTPMDLNIRKLFGRIERQMRAIVRSETGDVLPVINEMLYLIGSSHASSDRIEQIKQSYALEQYYPVISAAASAEDKQSYEELRDQMQEAEDNWEQCVAGDRDACVKFVEYVEKIAKKSDKLERKTPHYLTKKIEGLSKYLRDPAYARLIGEDVAMALMLWRSGMTQYETMDSRFQEQARILSDQIDAAMNQMPEDAQRIAELISLYSQTEQGAVKSSLANEMLANLQIVEQVLNEFFGDVTKRNELSNLQRLLVQIHGGLHILSLKHAEQLLLEMQARVRIFADSDAAPKMLETQALASAVSALHEYLQHMANGQNHHTKALISALNELTGLDLALFPPAEPVLKTGAAAEIQRPSGGDLDLLEIFLEEANEVLGIMRDNIEICKLQPDNMAPLITIRRGFHTLKGSGRMVGLLDLGEVAWAAERAMQKRLQGKKASSPALLSFIEDAVAAFSVWAADLERQGYVSVEAHDLIASARNIENGLETSIGAEAPATEASVAAPEEPVVTAVSEEIEPDAVVIGDISLSTVLFKIASEEASQNVVALRRQFDGLLSARPALVQYDFMRAAHTLAGICRSLGFTSVVDLAGNLEGWLQANIDIPVSISEHQLQMLAEVVVALDGMVQSICAKKMPNKYEDLVRRVLADKHTVMSEGELQAQMAEEIEDIAESRAQEIAEKRAKDMAEAQAMEAARAQEMAREIAREKALLEEQALADARAKALAEIQAKEIARARAEHIASQVEQARAERVSEAQAEMMSAELRAREIAHARIEQVVEAARAEEALRLEQQAELIAGEKSRATEAATKVKAAAVPEQKIILRDDVDAQLLPIFMEEADELTPKIGSCLRALREKPEDEPHLLNRLLHTLKGSARMTGAMRIGDIAHTMEDRLLAEDRSGAEFWDTLETDFDRINVLLEELRTGHVTPEPAAEAGSSEVTDAADIDNVAAITQLSGVERTQIVGMLRVRSDVVDRLVNQAGEISVARSRMETELRAFKEGLLELTGSVTRLRKQLREVEIQAESQMQARVSLNSESNERFDPLEFDRFTRLQELTRFMNESVHDVHTVQQSLLKNIDETNSVIFAQSRMNRDLQQSLMSVRMVPFGSMSERLYRLVRQTAKELNKRVNLELTGTGVELDRSMLEKMTAPFDHMLRNAIAHGLEDERLRVASGKDAIGEVRLSLRQENNEIVFEFSDDGAGLDFAALRANAISKGLLDADNLTVNEDQLAQLIFATGVSTANEVTEVAGRGIGMDVVRSEISALGGRIEVSSRAGLGTNFTIRLPLTLAVTQVLMVRAGDAIFAVPSTMVEQVRQVKPAVLKDIYTEQKVEWEDKVYPLHYLRTLLGDEAHLTEKQPHNPLLLLRSGNQRIALHVDELLGNKEAVVKNIGPQLARMPGIAGASVLGDGSVVLILNPIQMTQRIGSAAQKIRKVEPVVLRAQPLIMVVDDSLTVRKITTRLLTRAGYQVVTAKDGVDALEQLTEIMPDVMLLDVEMPRMDGFELTKLLRRDEKTKNLPIIMITSRTADKHRDFAIQLGVNAYLGKPYQEDELLQQIAGYIDVSKAA